MYLLFCVLLQLKSCSLTTSPPICKKSTTPSFKQLIYTHYYKFITLYIYLYVDRKYEPRYQTKQNNHLSYFTSNKIKIVSINIKTTTCRSNHNHHQPFSQYSSSQPSISQQTSPPSIPNLPPEAIEVPILELFMHDILGGSNSTARPITGLLGNIYRCNYIGLKRQQLRTISKISQSLLFFFFFF